jgi:hypothetical protein
MSASGVSRITCESGPCSACDSRSEATKSGVGAAVGNHQHFRRAGRHIDGRAVQTLADLAFGFGHVSVARAKDFIDLRHRFGAERQGGNRLRAADVKDGLHAAQLRGIEDLIGNRRRRAEHHLLTAGDARRRRQHQHRGEQRRRAAGNIQPDGGDRAGDLLAAHARQGFDIHRLQLLRVVEGLDVFHRHGHRLLELVAEALAGGGDFRSVTCSAATSVLSNFALYSRSAASPLALTLSGSPPPCG